MELFGKNLGGVPLKADCEGSKDHFWASLCFLIADQGVHSHLFLEALPLLDHHGL